MNISDIIEQIKHLRDTLFPEVELVLFGSQARGDATEDSDIDILALFNKDTIQRADRVMVSHPLYELELRNGVIITPIFRTKKQWQSQANTFFKQNIQREGIRL